MDGLPAGVVRHIMPITKRDEAIIRQFPCYQGPGTAGFITDFLGVKTRASFIATLPQEGGIVEGYPIPGDHHATGLEWAGTLRAVLDAGPEVVAVELGAGWGPWLVTVATLKRNARVRLVGVEGSQSHYEYLRTHFRDNGINPDEHTLLHGIAATTDGDAEFPVLEDPAFDWGTAAIPAGSARPAHHSRTESVKAYSLPTLLKPFAAVDLVHIDIQGHEADVVIAARDVLREKVKRIVIGTHSRTIEQQLIDELGTQGWTLEAEEPCLFTQTDNGFYLFIDGCQVWRNRKLLPDRA